MCVSSKEKCLALHGISPNVTIASFTQPDIAGAVTLLLLCITLKKKINKGFILKIESGRYIDYVSLDSYLKEQRPSGSLCG